MSKPWLCGVCERKVTIKSIVCLSCQQWIHWNCANIKTWKEAALLERTFKCVICIDSSKDDDVDNVDDKNREESINGIKAEISDSSKDENNVDKTIDADNIDDKNGEESIDGDKGEIGTDHSKADDADNMDDENGKGSIDFDKGDPSGSRNDNDDISDDEHSSDDAMIDKLNNGVEVYLCKNGKDIFKANFEKTPLGTMVHGQELDADSGRFFILKILKDANNWKKFDVDKYCVGVTIKWDLKSVRWIKQKKHF